MPFAPLRSPRPATRRMDDLRQGFGRIARAVTVGAPGAANAVSAPLEVREVKARLIGEVLAFAGLLALLAALFFWRQISGYDFIRNGWIDLPSHVAAAWDFAAPKVGHVTPSEYRHDPHGAGFFMVVLCFITFSAILRRRWVLLWSILGFCLVPWPILGLAVPGVGFAATIILVAGMGLATRQRQFARAGMFLVAGVAVWTYFSLGMMHGSDVEKRSAVRFAVSSTPGAIKTGPSKRDDKLSSMSALDWPESLGDAKAYLIAQDAFFRGEPYVVAANLPRAELAFGAEPYASLRIAGLRQYLLSEGIGSSEALSAYKARRWRTTIVTDALLGLGSLLVIVGLSIEWFAGRIRGRIGRLDVLSRKVEAAQAVRQSATASFSTASTPPIPGDDIFAESLRRVRYRLRWFVGVGAPFIGGGVALALLALYLQVPSAHANDGFVTVHMLGPVFDNFPNGFQNVTENQKQLLVAPVLWPYILGAVLAIVLLGLRRFRLLLALIVLMVFGGQLSSFVFPRGGVVEIAASDFKPGTIKSIEAASNGSTTTGDPQRDRKLEAYHYALAQLAYLTGDPARTAQEVAAVGTLDFWAYPSVEWRLAIMREWIAANKITTPGSNPASHFAMPEDGRLIADWILRAALLLIGLGSPAVLLASIYLWRHSRILDLQSGHAQLDATRRIKSLT